MRERRGRGRPRRGERGSVLRATKWVGILGLGCLGLTPASAEELSDLSRPFSLSELIRLAEERNLGLAQSLQGVETARGSYTGSFSAFLPSIRADADYNRVTSNFSFQITDPVTGRQIEANEQSVIESYGLGVSGNQNILNLPAWYRYRQSAHSLSAARLGYDFAEVELAWSVTQQYYALMQAEELARVSREAYDLSQQQLDRARTLFEVGSVAKSDVLQSQVNRATSERDRIARENQIEQERARLALLLALPVDAALQIGRPDPLPEDLDLESEEELRQRALTRRADLGRAQAEVQASRAGERAARWARFPSLGGNAFYAKQAETAGDLDQLDQDYRWGFGLGINAPIFDGLETKGSIQQATAQRRQEERALDEARLQVALEVRESLLAIKNGSEGIRSAREGVALAEESVRLQQALYENGGGTLLEWNNAQVELTRARVSLVEAEVSLHLALAQLEKALGGSE